MIFRRGELALLLAFSLFAYGVSAGARDKVRVDQCAFGRRSQKPTGILTNVSAWEPTGTTRAQGRCVVGKCAGTLGNRPGDARHTEQTVPSSKDRRPSQGAIAGGRREYTREAVVNAVAPDLVREIVGAVLQGGDRERPRRVREGESGK